MRRYFCFILLSLLLLSPSWALAKKKHRTTRSRITNSIYFGGEYSLVSLGQAGGGYIGVETHFGVPYISLLNDFGLGYLRVGNISLFSESRKNNNAMYLHYSLGLRIYLGIRYVFVDVNAGVSSYFAVPYKKHASDVFFLGTVALGFNIPLYRGLNLQISAGVGRPLLVGFQARAGLQFRL